MKWADNMLQMACLVGFIFMVAGMIQYVFAPKKINHLYGYRTKNSMESEERWHFAQKYYALKMIAAGVFLMLFSMITLVVEMIVSIQIILQAVMILLCIVYLFYSTERALKTRFPKK